MATLTSKGQVTLPTAIRDALGLGPGSQVEFELEEGKIVLRKRVPAETLQRWEGYLRSQLPAGSVDEMMELLRGERVLDGGNKVGSVTQRAELIRSNVHAAATRSSYTVPPARHLWHGGSTSSRTS
jgi:AbrB family looped-hinge helix DNA binding protein